MAADGLCGCGCGERTPLASTTNRTRGWVKGVPIRFIHGHHARPTGRRYEMTETGCWEWRGYIGDAGYPGRISFRGGKEYPHRIAWIGAHGPIPDGMVIHHVCQVRRCVNPAHLELMPKEAHGRLHAPDTNPACRKLDAEQVKAIRVEAKNGTPYGFLTAFARRFDVSVPCIARVVAGDTYREVVA